MTNAIEYIAGLPGWVWEALWVWTLAGYVASRAAEWVLSERAMNWFAFFAMLPVALPVVIIAAPFFAFRKLARWVNSRKTPPDVCSSSWMTTSTSSPS